MTDVWCSPIFDGGQWLYGGAARNKRLSVGGGMQKICEEVGQVAARAALEKYTAAAEPKLSAKVVPLSRRRKA